MSLVSISCPPDMYPANIKGFIIARPVYKPAVYPAGPEPMMMTFRTSDMSATNLLSGGVVFEGYSVAFNAVYADHNQGDGLTHEALTHQG